MFIYIYINNFKKIFNSIPPYRIIIKFRRKNYNIASTSSSNLESAIQGHVLDRDCAVHRVVSTVTGLEGRKKKRKERERERKKSKGKKGQFYNGQSRCSRFNYANATLGVRAEVCSTRWIDVIVADFLIARAIIPTKYWDLRGS